MEKNRKYTAEHPAWYPMTFLDQMEWEEEYIYNDKDDGDEEDDDGRYAS